MALAMPLRGIIPGLLIRQDIDQDWRARLAALHLREVGDGASAEPSLSEPGVGAGGR